jgi:hypothetical protein
MCKTRPFETERYGKFDEIAKNLSETCHKCNEILQIGEFTIHQKYCKSLYLKALSIMAKELPDQNISSPRDLFETLASSGLVFQTEVTELFADSGAGGGTISGRFVNGRPNGFGFF